MLHSFSAHYLVVELCQIYASALNGWVEWAIHIWPSNAPKANMNSCHMPAVNIRLMTLYKSYLLTYMPCVCGFEV